MARLIVTACGLAVMVAVRPLAVAGVGGLLVVAFGGSAVVRRGWPATVVQPVDVVAVALVAAAAGLRTPSGIVALGVGASVPLAAVAAFDLGRDAGARIAAAAIVAGAVSSGVTGHWWGVVAAVGVAPVAAWAVWGGMRSAALARELDETEAREQAARQEMITTVSHELRTPLTIIQGATSTLSKRWEMLSEPERLDLIDVLIDNVASLDSSILHFVDAARLARGTMSFSPEWIDLPAALEAVQTKLASVLSGRHIETDLPLRRVWADRSAVASILEHLLVNAVRFSAMGLPITVRCVGDGTSAVISVTDRGRGIPPHLLTKVWEPLERGDVGETGVSRGAGLGLPIVRELARLHGGDAELASTKGRGTTVRVRFPQPAESPPADGLSDFPKLRWRRRSAPMKTSA